MGRLGALLALVGLIVVNVVRLRRSLRFYKRDRTADVQTLFDGNK